MANHHLRNRELSLKAKGLLSLMLSLPEDWDYTTKGLSCICKDGVDSISTAVKELESSGYIQRRRVRDAHGRLSDVEYIIMEKPVSVASNPAAPKCQNPILDNPIVENPDMENPRLEKSSQLSKKEFSKDHKNNALNNREIAMLSLPVESGQSTLFFFDAGHILIKKMAGKHPGTEQWKSAFAASAFSAGRTQKP